MDKDTVEIIREARKAGMQMAIMLFASLCIVAALFGYYIYQSYQPSIATITQTQDGENNNQELINGEANTNS